LALALASALASFQACSRCGPRPKPAPSGSAAPAPDAPGASPGAKLKDDKVPRERFALFDHDNHARAMAIGPDASIYVVGGTGRVERGTLEGRFGNHQSAWVARYSLGGAKIWEHTLAPVRGNDQGVVHDVVVKEDGTACVLEHEYAGFPHLNDRVRCFSAEGQERSTFELPIRWSTRLLSLGDGRLVAGGAKSLPSHGGRAYAAAWIGDALREPPGWEGTQVGTLGSYSAVTTMARAQRDEIIAGGFLGRSDKNDASWPWIAKWTASGELLWSETASHRSSSHQAVRAVTVAPDGSLLAAGFSDTSWVRRYDANGELVSEQRWPPTVQLESIAASAEGYVVGGWSSPIPYAAGPREPAHWKLAASSLAGTERWSLERSDCLAVWAVAIHQGLLIALGECDGGLGLVGYEQP
jgi:hypothetical protein